ncbi:hypothetical protein FOB73_16525 [Yersinia pseudotuberculosis]|nr:hypothetical protein FOB73_16525 [Yersinia pseudotuberculosis]
MIGPVIFCENVKGVYRIKGAVIDIFQSLLIVTCRKLLQSVVCTGMELDRAGLATYNRFHRAPVSSGTIFMTYCFYEVIVFIKQYHLYKGAY